MSYRAFGCQHHHADDPSRAAVPLDGLLESALDKGDPLLFRHVLLPVRVTVAVYVGRARAADRVRLLVERAAEGDGVNLPAVPVVVTCDDDAGAEEMPWGQRYCYHVRADTKEEETSYLSWSLLS